jgi:CheY-like chemotaxis protein
MENLSKGPILIVEDDHDIAESIAELVRSDGYDARMAANGQQALRELRIKPHPQCILLDLMMPVMSGWDFLETLQDEQPELRDIPVIVVSAAHNPQLPVGVRLLPKPLDWNTLTRAINDMITRH